MKKAFDSVKVGECFRWRTGGQRAKKRGALTFTYEDDTTHRRRARGPMRKRRVRMVSCPANLKGSRGSRNKSVRIGYDVFNVFQRYWYGQGDPLYAVLSRRGTTVDWATVRASRGEIDRLCETADEAIKSGDKIERRVGRAFKQRHPGLCRR